MVLLNSILIFINLFKKEFFWIFFLVFVSFVILTIIPIVINSYKQFLEDSLATKQPHITIEYIDQNKQYTPQQINQLEQQILDKFQNKIVSINSYVSNKAFVNLKSYGYNLSEFTGYVKFIGLPNNKYNLCYDFDNFVPVMLDEYGFKITGIEIFENFRQNSNNIFFNYALYNSIKPLVTYEAKFDISLKLHNDTKSYNKANFLAIVQDFYNQPIIYSSISFVNQIFHQNKNHISGFMINIANQQDLYTIQQQLNNFFNSKTKQAIITNWKDSNKKQNDIFKIFTQVGNILKFIIFVLSTGATTIFLYKTILQKQPNLRILNMLGLRLVVVMDSAIALLIFVSVVSSSFVAHNLISYIYANILNLTLDISYKFYIYDIVVAYIVLVLFVVIIVNNIFKQKNSLFK